MTYQQKYTFEDFLMDKHGEQYCGLDDDMQEDFERWICEELDTQEIIDFADEYVVKMIKEKHPNDCDCDICIK